MNKGESQLIWEQYTEQAKSNNKPDKDGDGVPDWADKKPGKDDHAEKDDDTVKEGTWHIGPHEAAQKFYKYVIDNAETYMNAFEKVKAWQETWEERLMDIGGEAFGDDELYDNIASFIEKPTDSSLHKLRRSAEVALGLTKKQEREMAQGINEAKPGSALDMLGLEPEDFEHDDPDQAAFDRMDDDSPFDFDDGVPDMPSPDELQGRPAADDHAETLLDVVKMLEDKHFDYTFNVDNQTIKMKSDKGDEYILKIVGRSGAHDIPVSLR